MRRLARVFVDREEALDSVSPQSLRGKRDEETLDTQVNVTSGTAYDTKVVLVLAISGVLDVLQRAGWRCAASRSVQ
jgi:hypothetical protein